MLQEKAVPFVTTEDWRRNRIISEPTRQRSTKTLLLSLLVREPTPRFVETHFGKQLWSIKIEYRQPLSASFYAYPARGGFNARSTLARSSTEILSG
jgi:hypothetical protein